MPSYRTATVEEILSERPGLQRVLAGGDRAYVLTQLVGPVRPGDPVVLNTTAVELGLGTGGWHVVHWNLARQEWSQRGPGHVLKLRYTSLQVDTGAEEETVGAPSSLDGMPVVACGLHSQVAGVAVVVKHLRPRARLAYLMTDGAALPLALSDLVHDLRQAGLLDLTISTGHAFGGDVEAVNVHSGLALARHLGADAVIAGIGPGVVGTGTRLGHTGLDVVTILDATSALGGTAILAERVSEGDPRERHRGVSHHTDTARELTSATPLDTAAALDQTPDVGALLAARGLRVTSMGRGPEEDPVFFQWCGAAGVVAARQVRDPAAASEATEGIVGSS
ncbi:MAG: DUF3866 family protein [Actinobacteria bacterium]|nr:DUF3866 family protein [Actinomycetota bacterium]